MARVAVVLLNWNGEEVLKRFLPSVMSNISYNDYDIIIADNGSTDNSLAFLKSNYPTLRVIALDSNYGYAEGYNRALKEVDAEYYLLLNTDVELKSDPIPPMLSILDNNKTVGAVMPKILSHRNPTFFEYAGAAGGYIDKFGFPFCRGRIISTVEEDRGQYNTTEEVFWASGAALMIRSSLFWSLEGFDSSFFAYMEEIDLCWRAKNMGYKIVCCCDSEVYHLGAATLGSDSPFKLYLNYRNTLYMLHKNSISHKREVFRRMVIDGMLSIIYLLTFKRKSFGAVIKAHKDYRKAIPELDIKRGRITQQRVSGVYGGSIIVQYALGKKLFNKLKYRNYE